MGKKAGERRLADNEAMAFAAASARARASSTFWPRPSAASRRRRRSPRLTFSTRRIAGEVKKVLVAAIANAENNHQLDVHRLYVAEASVGKALVMKRFHARARGRGARIEKPISNLRIIVRELSESKAEETA